MARVFLSYAREDHLIVAELHRDLAAMGNQVFFDQELTGGQAWWSTLLEQIRGCDIFVPVVGKAWLDSSPCRLEAGYAHQLGRMLLPVVVGDVSAKLLPHWIAETQRVSYHPAEKGSVLNLARAVSSVPASAPLPDPLPVPPAVPISYLTELREQVQVQHDITRQGQDVLLAEFRRRAESRTDVNELIVLLQTFRRRPDLNVHVAGEIDRLLAQLQASSPAQAPQQPWIPAATDGHQRAGNNPSNGKLVGSYVLSAVSIVFLPIIFGPIAMGLALSAKKHGKPGGQTAFIVALIATGLGMIIGIAIWTSTVENNASKPKDSRIEAPNVSLFDGIPFQVVLDEYRDDLQ